MARLRLMTVADIPEGMRLKDIAGWNQTPADWERFLRASPAGCFVAEVEGLACGTAATIIYEDRFAWVGMVLVDPAYRGRGIGTRLLEKAIEYLDACRVPTIKLDATPQGKPIYEKLGFVSEYEIERWVLQRDPARTTAVAPRPRLDLDEVLKMDSRVFGADRSAVLRSIDHEAPELALDAGSGEFTSYVFARRGSQADHLGPWVCVYREAADRLLEEFMRRSARQTVFVDAMKSHPWAISLLQSRGFEFSRPLTRMYRGPNRHAGCPHLMCAILGPEFG